MRGSQKKSCPRSWLHRRMWLSSSSLLLRRFAVIRSLFSPQVAPGTASSPLPGGGAVALRTEAAASAATAVVVDPVERLGGLGGAGRR